MSIETCIIYRGLVLGIYTYKSNVLQYNVYFPFPFILDNRQKFNSRLTESFGYVILSQFCKKYGLR